MRRFILLTAACAVASCGKPHNGRSSDPDQPETAPAVTPVAAPEDGGPGGPGDPAPAAPGPAAGVSVKPRLAPVVPRGYRYFDANGLRQEALVLPDQNGRTGLKLYGPDGKVASERTCIVTFHGDTGENRKEVCDTDKDGVVTGTTRTKTAVTIAGDHAITGVTESSMGRADRADLPSTLKVETATLKVEGAVADPAPYVEQCAAEWSCEMDVATPPAVNDAARTIVHRYGFSQKMFSFHTEVARDADGHILREVTRDQNGAATSGTTYEWLDGRVELARKTEGPVTELTAYEYDAAGRPTTAITTKNGALTRVASWDYAARELRVDAGPGTPRSVTTFRTEAALAAAKGPEDCRIWTDERADCIGQRGDVQAEWSCVDAATETTCTRTEERPHAKLTYTFVYRPVAYFDVASQASVARWRIGDSRFEQTGDQPSSRREQYEFNAAGRVTRYSYTGLAGGTPQTLVSERTFTADGLTVTRVVLMQNGVETGRLEPIACPEGGCGRPYDDAEDVEQSIRYRDLVLPFDEPLRM